MMKSRSFILGIVVFWSLCCSDCAKNSGQGVAADQDTTLNAVFVNFWNQMNADYLWWDQDTTDWAGVYRQYQPLLKNLNIHSQRDVSLAVSYFTAMTSGLIDAHYSIDFTSPFLAGVSTFPALNRKMRDPNWHPPYPYLTVDTTYLDAGYRNGSYVSSDGQRISALSGTIGGKVLYFGCDGFALQEAYQAPSANGVKDALSLFFSRLNHIPATIHAIILDVRGNPGGNVADLSFLMGHLTAKRTIFGYTRYKSGSGRLDYTPWIEASVDPYPGSVAPQVPVIVLADNHSISMAEAVVMVAKQLPSGSFVGETTWGATGPIVPGGVFNGGSFGLPGFLSVVASSAEFKYIDGNCYEGKGFRPDIPVKFDLASLNAGKDAALETAIGMVH
jgi:hypothetical protein